MLHLNSRKYFEECNFKEFISENGGSTYASTECETTTLYFEIDNKYLLPALERFVAVLTEPLIEKEILKQWRTTIEKDLQINLLFYKNIKEQLLSSFAQTGHPSRKFFKDDRILHKDDETLLDEILIFKRHHYSAHRMKFVVEAHLPTYILEKYISKCFSDFPRNKLLSDDFTIFKEGSFHTPTFQKMYTIKPVDNISRLEVTWPMPSLFDYYLCKPHQYISWIIEHRGKGTLTSYLRKKWNCEVTCNNESSFMHNSMYTLFNLTVTLSDVGLQHLEEILDAIFSFINLLKEEGPQKRIYNEIHKIKEDNFRFLNDDKAYKMDIMKGTYVQNLSKKMHFYPSRDYITGNKLYFAYNPNYIQYCLNYLKPETANIIISCKSCIEFNKITSWSTEIPNELIENWNSIKPLPDFHLPLQNAFLTYDFSLMKRLPVTPKYPIKLHKDYVSEIWYYPNPRFYFPKCYVYFHFVSSLALQSLKNTTLMDIYCNVLSYLLEEELYPATIAGLHYEIKNAEKGITIKINGFNEKMPLLLTTIAKYIKDYPILVTKDLFERIKVQLLNTYYNSFMDPRTLVENVKLSILKFVHYTFVDIHTAIRTINFEDFHDFVKSFTNNLYIQCLVQGNMTKNTVKENVLQFVKIINCNPLTIDVSDKIKMIRIPLGTNYCKLKNVNKFDATSVVINYYQTNIVSIKLLMLIQLIIEIMTANSLCLKSSSVEQAFNDVSFSIKNLNGILGYFITVRTSANKHTTEYIDQKIEKYLQEFNILLKEFSEEELNLIKDAIKKRWHQDCYNAKLDVEQNWNEIIQFEYMFDILEKKERALRNITINDMREWFAKHIMNKSNYRKLSVQVAGTNENKKEIMKPNREYYIYA
ncbi:Nardilysin [Cyphomyrmex costatus]|uniref:Nardilysin n=1 Tax=Cyphomyrmex costatus TaxID=456900 RepID=A0A195CCT4_9HYME|nr:Nardilysin [Cyphomyrmex costatus]